MTSTEILALVVLLVGCPVLLIIVLLLFIAYTKDVYNQVDDLEDEQNDVNNPKKP